MHPLVRTRIAAALAAATLALVATGAARPAAAGTLMVTEGRGSGGVDTNEVRVQGTNMRVDHNEGGQRSTFVMAGETMYVIDHARRSYTVLDRAAMQRIAGRMAQARQQMQAQMANLPPEARARMQQMMAGVQQAPARAARTEYRRTARTGSAAGIACKVWEGFEGGRKTEELCVAPAAALPGGTEMLAAMKQMARNMEQMTAQMGFDTRDAMQAAWRQLDTVGGVPIVMSEYAGTRATQVTTLKAMRAEAIPAASFAPPAGYRREQMNLGER